MIKRLMAWVVLVGFVLLIINIIFIGIAREVSFGVYLVFAALFLYISNKVKNNKK